jgi:hypothetical protein
VGIVHFEVLELLGDSHTISKQRVVDSWCWSFISSYQSKVKTKTLGFLY